MSKSTKLDQSIARARNVVHEGVVEDVSLATLGEEQVAAAVQTFDPHALAALVASGAVTMGPQLLTLAPTQMIKGIVESEGVATFEDENTKLPKDVKTWQIALVDPTTHKRTGLRVSILSSAQLDREIPPLLKSGNVCIIARGGEINIKGGKKRMTQYFVLEFKPGATTPAAVATGAGA